MLIHQYSSSTGEYVSSQLADINPKNPEEWLIPAFSTSDPLPDRTPKTWPFRRDDKWVMLPDYRGLVLYRQDTGEQAELLMAGTTPAENGLAETPRPSSDHVWRDGEWQLDEARVAKRAHDTAMAEFEALMTMARDKNRGKSDALAAGMLTTEEKYYFQAWSAFQLALVRIIESDGFPSGTQWPGEPVPFDQACGSMLAEFEARMSVAREELAESADAYAARALSGEEILRYDEWTFYARALQIELDAHLLDGKPTWPKAPEPVRSAQIDTPAEQPGGDTPTQATS